MAKDHFYYKEVCIHHLLKDRTLTDLPFGSLSCRGQGKQGRLFTWIIEGWGSGSWGFCVSPGARSRSLNVHVCQHQERYPDTHSLDTQFVSTDAAISRCCGSRSSIQVKYWRMNYLGQVLNILVT